MAEHTQPRGLELACVVHPDVPTIARGDPGRRRQILLNLAGNALKFTHEGGVTVRVSASPGAPEQVLLRVEITDTGIGIAPEAQARLFVPFSQADTSTTLVEAIADASRSARRRAASAATLASRICRPCEAIARPPRRRCIDRPHAEFPTTPRALRREAAKLGGVPELAEEPLAPLRPTSRRDLRHVFQENVAAV